MTHLIAILLCTTGFAALAATMQRHRSGTLAAHHGRMLQVGGWAALALSLIVAMAGLGADYGAVSWFGYLSAGAVIVLTGINWRRASGR